MTIWVVKIIVVGVFEKSLLNIDDYPQMRLLAWNRVVRDIPEDEAFALYEANWRYVDKEQLTNNEACLLDRLTRQYGHGVLNV